MDNSLITQEVIEEKIFIIRGHKVMLSTHLANIYRVSVKVLMQSVKRNIERFPADFMFQLTGEEFRNLKSQFVTSSWGGIRRANPYAFTEQGVAMLSSILRSRRAIRINIAIMRAFVRLRRIILNNKELADKLVELERKIEKHDTEIIAIFEVIRQLMEPPPQKEKSKIGFHTS
jgi:aromatic ring-opening dioxygenase LigB subunit